MIAPLVPELINENLNLLVAVLVGFGFGFALEQAGFSSTRKLAGLFYGYDFTVLRVFFTAGVTAMLGSLILGKLGWLDLSLIYINPTFLYSAMLGGAIMGLGFIIGGFCPGTSIVGAVIGRIDAMFFVLGGALGIYLFGEFFPFYKELYTAENMGGLMAYDVLGISKEVFAFGLTVVALAAFVGTYWVQSRVTKKEATALKDWKKALPYAAFGLTLLLPASVILLTPDKDQRILTASESTEIMDQQYFRTYTPEKLAYKIMKSDSVHTLVDVRSAHAFKAGNIPTSINIPIDSLQLRKYEDIFKSDRQVKVVYADDVEEARRAAFILSELHYPNVCVLGASSQQFDEDIMQEHPLPEGAGQMAVFGHRFRTKARKELPEIAQRLKAKPVAKVKKIRKIKGGC